MKQLRGLYRAIGRAYVTDDETMAFNVPEADYRAFGYQPDYDRLPWREDYVATAGATPNARSDPP